MIRPGYRLNDDDAMLLPIFPTPANPVGLTGFQTMAPGRAIDWGRFIDVDTRSYGGAAASDKTRLQFAYRIDASLVDPLTRLPPAVASNPDSLALRNLIRGLRLGLPSGQAVAHAMGITPLADKDIVIQKAVDPADVDPADPVKKIADIDPAFAHNCPLWTYILVEAAAHKTSVKIPVTENVSVNTPQLGPVGGRIVAEVFLGVLFGDGSSLLSLNPNWHPANGTAFALKDIVLYALGTGPALHYPSA
jgi:hypothetical protein